MKGKKKGTKERSSPPFDQYFASTRLWSSSLWNNLDPAMSKHIQVFAILDGPVSNLFPNKSFPLRASI